MRTSAALIAFVILGTPLLGFAKHIAPPRVAPIVHQGIRYVVPNDKGLKAYVEAWDVQTGRKLWTKTIFTHWYIPPFGTECMRYEYLTSMVIVDDRLVLTSERGRDYSLDPRTRSVRRVWTRQSNKALQ
jgi:hypothetical protein